MSGAPRLFEASFLDEVRRRTPLRTLVASRVKLQRTGKQWKGLCPFHKEKTPSFVVYDDGRFHCFGCGETGDVFAYVMKLEGRTFHDVVLHLASQAGIPIPNDRPGGEGQHQRSGGDRHLNGGHRQPDDGEHTNGEAESAEWEPILPVPATAPKPTAAMLQCDMLHEYWNADDRLLFYVRRHEAKGGRRKQFYPLSYGLLKGALGWHPRAPLSPRPLYRLNALSHADPAATVLLCEGEKCCNIAQMVFPDLVAMSWMGGVAAVQQVDWAPLDNRDVIIFPDADEVGRKAAAQIAKLLPLARILDTSGLPEGFDAADLQCDDPEAWLKARLPHDLPRVVWRDVRLSSWAGRLLPERRWVMPEWIPMEQVTGLYGVGGINKTDFLIQLMMCFSRGLPFCGYVLDPAPAYGLFVEDSEAEIVRRATRIAQRYGRTLADFPDFHFASLVGYAETEFVTFDGPKMVVGPALLRFDQAIVEHQARLCVLDTVPDFFGGNEIARREVSQFIRMLDAVSMRRGCGLVFTAHPSVRGEESGSLASGSTGWTGKVRARLSLHDPGDDDDEDEDDAAERRRLRLPPKRTDNRILIRQKSNYAEQGTVLKLICRNGVFTPEALDAAAAETRGPLRNAAAEVKFIELLPKLEAEIGHVHFSSVARDHYAPAVFAARKDSGGFSKAEFVRAMQRLLEAGRIKMVPFGPPSHGRTKLVIVA